MCNYCNFICVTEVAWDFYSSFRFAHFFVTWSLFLTLPKLSFNIFHFLRCFHKHIGVHACNEKTYGGSVDGWNPAPLRMMIIPLSIGFHTSQVVQDFFHQQYHPCLLPTSFHIFHPPKTLFLNNETSMIQCQESVKRKFLHFLRDETGKIQKLIKEKQSEGGEKWTTAFNGVSWFPDRWCLIYNHPNINSVLLGWNGFRTKWLTSIRSCWFRNSANHHRLDV